MNFCTSRSRSKTQLYPTYLQSIAKNKMHYTALIEIIDGCYSVFV